MPEVAIHHTADGTPYARPYLGTSPATGRQIRPYREFPGMTDEEAAAAAAAWVASIRDAQEADAPRVGELLERHIAAMEAAGASPHTIATYRLYARRYAATIAARPARDVTPIAIDDLLVHLMTEGPRGGRALARSTVLHFKWFLSGAFRRMVAWGVVPSNPVAEAMTVRAGGDTARALTTEEIGLVTEAIRRDRGLPLDTRRNIARANAALAMEISLLAGLRVGEACALRRRDFQANPASGVRSLTVAGTVLATTPRERRGTTKGGRSRGVVIGRELAQDIERHELAQTMGYLAPWRAGITVGPDLPIITTDGTWTSPRAVSARFRQVARESGLPPEVTYHSLRHTHATWLLTHGFDVKTVAARLGHASAETTLRVYAHVIPGRDADAAQAAAAMLDGGAG